MSQPGLLPNPNFGSVAPLGTRAGKGIASPNASDPTIGTNIAFSLVVPPGNDIGLCTMYSPAALDTVQKTCGGLI